MLGDLVSNLCLLLALSLDLGSLDFGGLCFLMSDLFVVLFLCMGLRFIAFLFCLLTQALIGLGLGLACGSGIGSLSSGVGCGSGVGL